MSFVTLSLDWNDCNQPDPERLANGQSAHCNSPYICTFTQAALQKAEF